MGSIDDTLDMQESVLDAAIGFDPMAALHKAMENSNGDVLSNNGASTNNVSADDIEVEASNGAENAITQNGITYSDENVDGVQESLDKMFAAVIAGGLSPKIHEEHQLLIKKAEVFKQAMNRFLGSFCQNIFEDEYAVLYSALSTLNIKVFSLNQLYTVMDYSSDDILASNKIHLDKYSYTLTGSKATDEEKLIAFKMDVGEKFNKLSRMYVSVEEFEAACAVYKMHFREQYMLELTQSMAMIMTDGLHEKVGKGRSRIWKGSNDCQEYYQLKLSILESIENGNGEHDDCLIDEDWLSEDLEEERNGETPIMLDTGIREIDDCYGGLCGGNMLEVMGPPKGGKTTVVQYLCERALEKGENVAVWALEGTKQEWLASIVSLMVRKKDGIVVDKRRIMKHIYKDERERQAVIAAKTELALSIKRGKLSFIEKACYAETMVSVLDNHWKNVNPFSVIAMDSPILAKSKTGKSRTDAAADAYTTLKHYISYEMANPAISLVTCQMKQEVIDAVRSNPDAEIDVTAGGVTAETIRTPDFIMCLISTKEERKMGQVKVHDVAARHTGSFDTFYMGAELGCCYFYSDPSLNEI